MPWHFVIMNKLAIDLREDCGSKKKYNSPVPFNCLLYLYPVLTPPTTGATIRPINGTIKRRQYEYKIF